ncbi:MAG: hypothetical protein IJK18_01400 [Clostridia bacterium]|nr:hypothetical protein [Clostridia bacterium]
MKNCIKKSLKVSNGITLIALVITIIVLLILAGISISMLSGNNGILQRATDAKTRTEKAQIIENAQTDILGQQTNNKGANITKEQLVAILNNYFKPTETDEIPDEVSSEDGYDLELETTDKKYKINLSEIFKGRFASANVETFGEKYEDTMIGKTINYKSGNNVNDWIVLGKQVNEQGKNDIIITTKNPVSSLTVQGSLAGWVDYLKTVGTSCSTFVGTQGTLGTKSAIIKEIRSIKLEDINNAVGFTVPETFDEFTFGTTNGRNWSTNEWDSYSVDYYYPDATNKTWINPTTSGTTWKHINDSYSYYKNGQVFIYGSSKNNWNYIEIQPSDSSKIDNMAYIIANGTSFWIASRSVEFNGYSAGFQYASCTWNGVGSQYGRLCGSTESGGEDANSAGQFPPPDPSNALRPVVVISSETPWDDVKDLIGNHATYN